jgi:large subunit ribosomal protein L19
MGLTIKEVKLLNRGYPNRYNHLPIGAKVRATLKVVEAGKERHQIFEGVLIRRRKSLDTSTVTLRKISFGVGVERVIPLNASTLVNLEPVTIHKVRRSKLYYLRNLEGNAAKLSALYGISQEELKRQITEGGEAGKTGIPGTVEPPQLSDPEETQDKKTN